MTVTAQGQYTAVVGGAAGGAGAYATTTQQAGAYNSGQGYGYCSTIYENGPGLPTEAQGQCGTILVLQADARSNFNTKSITTMLLGGLVVQVAAWLILMVR